MTCEAFFEYVADIFYPWLIKNKIALPVILFVDGHISHLSFQTSQFCEEKGIVLVALYPNATHLIQPMDVAVFKPLKEAWRRRVQIWRVDKIKNDEPHVLKKKDFAKLLHEVMDNTITKSILANGFRKCGLFPWNPLEVKVPVANERSKIQDDSKQIHYLKRGLQFLNDNINPEKLETFESILGEWSGDLVDLSLFNLWKKTKDELKMLQQFNQTNGSTLKEVGSLGVTVDDCLISDPHLVGFGSSAITGIDNLLQLATEQSASSNTDGVLETTMESSATAMPITIGDEVLMPISGSPAISIADGIYDTTLHQLDITAPDGMLEMIPESSTNAVVDGLNSGIYSVASTSDAVPNNVPSPFKKHFFYKTNNKKDTPKTRLKERIPTIVSGKTYQEYLQRKLEQKKELERLKIERAAEKLRKKEEKVSLKKVKALKIIKHTKIKRVKKNLRFSSSSSDSNAVVSSGESVKESENDTDQESIIVGLKPPQRVDGEFVIFKYENNFYPGKVLKAMKKTATISSMKANGRLWKWPDHKDVLDYPWDAVVAHIEEPRKTSSTRNVFDVPEIHSFI
ncbi:unnamed protein product [Parnassius mnemosyne]|uniref:DDE-1 domain-containing protein n=2 Tax=Parnassius mnemosyne TaxID=213953 RepID=A0AAV1KHP1_9NEOP